MVRGLLVWAMVWAGACAATNEAHEQLEGPFWVEPLGDAGCPGSYEVADLFELCADHETTQPKGESFVLICVSAEERRLVDYDVVRRQGTMHIIRLGRDADPAYTASPSGQSCTASIQ